MALNQLKEAYAIYKTYNFKQVHTYNEEYFNDYFECSNMSQTLRILKHLILVKFNHNNILYLPKYLNIKDDKVFNIFVKINICIIIYITHIIQISEEYISEILTRNNISDNYINVICKMINKGLSLTKLDEELYSNFIIMDTAIKYDNKNIQYIDHHIINTLDLCYKLINNNFNNILLLPFHIQQNKSIVFKAISCGFKAITELSIELQQDKEIILNAISKGFINIIELPIEIQQDKEIVMAAIKKGFKNIKDLPYFTYNDINHMLHLQYSILSTQTAVSTFFPFIKRIAGKNDTYFTYITNFLTNSQSENNIHFYKNDILHCIKMTENEYLYINDLYKNQYNVYYFDSDIHTNNIYNITDFRLFSYNRKLTNISVRGLNKLTEFNTIMINKIIIIHKYVKENISIKLDEHIDKIIFSYLYPKVLIDIIKLFV